MSARSWLDACTSCGQWPLDCRCAQARRNHRIARIALAIQRGGGDHLGDVASIHADFIDLIKELKELRHEPA